MYDHHRLFSKGFGDAMTDEERNRILDGLAEPRTQTSTLARPS
jgi:hypothetical protein